MLRINRPSHHVNRQIWLLALSLLITSCQTDAPSLPQNKSGNSQVDQLTHGLNSYYINANDKVIYRGLSPISASLMAQHPEAQAVGWYGFLKVDHDGDYGFTLSSGAQLSINNQVITSGTQLRLFKGQEASFKLRVPSGSAPVDVRWEEAQLPLQNLPTTNLSPASVTAGAPVVPTLPFPVLSVDFKQLSGGEFPAVWTPGLSGFQEGIKAASPVNANDPYWSADDYQAAFTTDGNASTGALKLGSGQEYNFYTSEMDVLRAGSVMRSGATYEVSAFVKSSAPTTCSAELLEPALKLKPASAAANSYVRWSETFIYTGKPSGLNFRLRSNGTAACQFDDVKITLVALAANLPNLGYNLLRNGDFDLQPDALPYWESLNGSLDLPTMTLRPGAGGIGKALGFENATRKVIATQHISAGQLYPNTRYVLQGKFRSAGELCNVVLRSGSQRTLLTTLNSPGTADWTAAKVLYTSPAVPEDLDIEPHLGQAQGATTCAVDDLAFGPEKVTPPAPPVPDPADPPVTVVAGIDPTVTQPAYFSGGDASFQATSVDETAEYQWDFGDGSQALGSDATHSYDVPGQYTAKLTVRSGNGQVTSQTMPVSVMPSIIDMPNARAVRLGNSTTLDVRYPAPGLEYQWKVDGTSTYTGSKATLTLDKPGFHDVVLTIYDKRSGVDINGQPPVLAQQETHINTVVMRPEANIIGSNTITSYSVNLDGTGSKADPKTTLTYAWDFGDGTTGSGGKVSHTYARAGRYAVALRVTDTFQQVSDAHHIVLTYQTAAGTGVLNYVRAQIFAGGGLCPPLFPCQGANAAVNPQGVDENRVPQQATSTDPVIQQAFAAAQQRARGSLILAQGQARPGTTRTSTILQAASTNAEDDFHQSHDPFVLPSSMEGFEIASAGEFSPDLGTPTSTSVKVNGASASKPDDWDVANCKTAGGATTCANLLVKKSALRYTHTGNNDFVITQRFNNGAGPGQLDYNINVPIINQLRVPHINVSIIPDTQLDDTSVHEWSFSNNGQDEMFAQINVRSSDITPDGYIPITVPVYAVDEQGKWLSDVSGVLNVFFNDRSLKSISREGVMYHGRTEVLAYIPVNSFSNGESQFDLTQLTVSASGACPTGWNDQFASAGHWVRGCKEMTASHLMPTGLASAGAGAASLNAQGLSAQWLTFGEIKKWTGSVDTKLFNAINYGKNALSRVSVDKLLAAYDGSTVALVVSLVPIAGDSIDLLSQLYNKASGKGADPVIVVLAGVGLGVDAFTGAGGELATAVKTVYKLGGPTSKEMIRVLVESVKTKGVREAFGGLKDSAGFMLEAVVKGNLKALEDALALAKEGGGASLDALKRFSTSYKQFGANLPNLWRIRVAKYGMYAPETAKAMAKCGSGCIDNFEEVLVQYSLNSIPKIDTIRKFALTVFNCTINPLSINNFSAQSLGPNVCLKNLIIFESRFNRKDLVYGIYYNGDIDKIRKRFSGVLMSKFMDNGKYTYEEIIAASKALIDSETKKGNTIRFTLSGIQDLKGVMAGTAPRIPAVTKAEIAYIRDNWSRLGNDVKWYLRDNEVPPPWLWKDPWVTP